MSVDNSRELSRILTDWIWSAKTKTLSSGRVDLLWRMRDHIEGAHAMSDDMRNRAIEMLEEMKGKAHGRQLRNVEMIREALK